MLLLLLLPLLGIPAICEYLRVRMDAVRLRLHLQRVIGGVHVFLERFLK
jgi:hypothetical protein